MFNVQIVGTANAIAAGWGNLGGGVTQILMPAIVQGLEASGVISFSAWRWSFFVPGIVFILCGLASFAYGQDSPLGDIRTMRSKGLLASTSESFVPTVLCAMLNYRTWVLAWNYGYSFGVGRYLPQRRRFDLFNSVTMLPDRADSRQHHSFLSL